MNIKNTYNRYTYMDNLLRDKENALRVLSKVEYSIEENRNRDISIICETLLFLLNDTKEQSELSKESQQKSTLVRKSVLKSKLGEIIKILPKYIQCSNCQSLERDIDKKGEIKGITQCKVCKKKLCFTCTRDIMDKCNLCYNYSCDECGKNIKVSSYCVEYRCMNCLKE